MSLDTVYHQGFAQRLLQRALQSNRMPHAYIFHGPDGVGKETLAVGLAQLLLCPSPIQCDLGPDLAKTVGLEQLQTGCGQCEDCRSVLAGTHPDLHRIYRQLSREHPKPEVRKRKAIDIGVDVLRHFVIDRVALTPHRGRAKVFIIREADRITVQAQNALLKTLEEPQGTTFLILLVESTDRLLPTTLSRCQTVRLDALPMAFVKERLAANKPQLPPAQIDWHAGWGSGSLGLALQAVDDGLFEINERIVGQLVGIKGKGQSHGQSAGRSGRQTILRPGELITLLTDQAKAIGEHYRKRDPDITDTEATRRGLKSVMKMIAIWLADVLRVTSGESVNLVNIAQLNDIQSTASNWKPLALIEAIHRLARAEQHLDLNVNTQLVVETLVNDLSSADQKDAVKL